MTFNLIKKTFHNGVFLSISFNNISVQRMGSIIFSPPGTIQPTKLRAAIKNHVANNRLAMCFGLKKNKNQGSYQRLNTYQHQHRYKIKLFLKRQRARLLQNGQG